MFIDQYFSEKDGRIRFSREQGSRFAKEVADDFNPLHDEDAKRFCIPGDLLFAVVLARYGVSQHMEFTFSGMVLEDTELLLPEPAGHLLLRDANGKDYLDIVRGGDNSSDEALIQSLTRSYVDFSGHTFPHILEPLLASANVMMNPARPMVMYVSMTIDLDRLDISAPVLEGGDHRIDIDGKRGGVELKFNLVENGEIVGRGAKRLILGGLREYDKAAMEAAIADFDNRKRAYCAG